MQQFQVPQFIDVEDRIFGPLTVKQFIYLMGGGGFLLILWLIGLPTVLFFILAGIVAAFFGSLAFLKVNGQPAVTVLNNALNHITQGRLYIWKRGGGRKNAGPATMQAAGQAPYTPKLTKSKLKELSWSLDINRVENRPE